MRSSQTKVLTFKFHVGLSFNGRTPALHAGNKSSILLGSTKV